MHEIQTWIDEEAVEHTLCPQLLEMLLSMLFTSQDNIKCDNGRRTRSAVPTNMTCLSANRHAQLENRIQINNDSTVSAMTRLAFLPTHFG